MLLLLGAATIGALWINLEQSSLSLASSGGDRGHLPFLCLRRSASPSVSV